MKSSSHGRFRPFEIAAIIAAATNPDAIAPFERRPPMTLAFRNYWIQTRPRIGG
jgi:hypothetical protein